MIFMKVINRFMTFSTLQNGNNAVFGQAQQGKLVFEICSLNDKLVRACSTHAFWFVGVIPQCNEYWEETGRLGFLMVGSGKECITERCRSD